MTKLPARAGPPRRDVPGGRASGVPRMARPYGPAGGTARQAAQRYERPQAQDVPAQDVPVQDPPIQDPPTRGGVAPLLILAGRIKGDWEG